MKRAVVVGAGVIGLACAYSLRQRDYEVTIVDAKEPGAGASEGNAGWVTPSLSMPVPAPGMVGQSLRWMLRSDSPLFIRPTLDPRRIAWLVKLLRNCKQDRYERGFAATARLNAGTFDSFDRLAADGVEFEMHRAGLLFCFLDPSSRPHILEELERVRELGYSPRALDGGEMHELEPHLAPNISSGLYLQQERQVRPESLITGYVKKLLDADVDIRPASPVLGFEKRRQDVAGVRTPDEVIEADEIVIAAGAHSGRLAVKAGQRVPIEAGKGYSLHYEPAPVEVAQALYLYEARVGVTPLDGGLRLAGTMEFSGLNTRLLETRLRAIERAGRGYLTPFPDGRRGTAWAGMRPMTPDGLPVIGRLRDNITIASGHAMLGVTLAPVTGDLVAQVISDNQVPEVLKPFDPLRFDR